MKTNGARETGDSNTRASSITRRTYISTLFFVLTASFALLAHQRSFLLKTYAVCSASAESTVYTVDEARPKVECLVVRGTKIAWTGSEGDMERWRNWEEGPMAWVLQSVISRLKVFRVKAGHIVVPGLADAHAHVLDYGWKMQLELDGSNSVEEVLRRVKEYILSHPDVLADRDRWIVGMGWDQTKWPIVQFPTASDFDREPLLRGRPIALLRIDGHASWVSPRVLELMRPLPESVDGGDIVRDGDGNPTGIFIDNALLLIPTPEPSDAQMVEYFEIAMRDALKHGLTSIHDATVSPRQIHFFKKLAEEGRLPIRLYVMGHVVGSDKYWGSQIPRLEDYGVHGRLNVRSIKLVADGALGSWGAALLEPYSDKPETSGLILITPSKLADLVKRFWKDGWQVNVHGIGDHANKVILDIFENIILEEGVDVEKWRPRLEHAQIMTIDDLERIGRLGVLPSVQPTHATSDMWYAESRLGPERIKGAYAYRSLLNSSRLGVLPLGSDFPIEGINPLLGFYAAVSRLSTSGKSPHGPSGWYPSEALTQTQALKGMTLDAAYAAFAERDLGSLTPGKRADFVVLDRNIMSVSIEQVLETKVKATIIDGGLIFGGLE